MKNLAPIWLLVCLLMLSCQPKEVKFDDAICIRNISTIDPTEGLKNNQTVIIMDGKIHQIAPSGELPLSPENEIIDGTGKYLIPGLWDAHVHFAYMEELAPRMFDLFLAHGITSVRDTGGETSFVKKWKDRAKASPTTSPRVMIAGPLLDGMPNVYDGSEPSRPPLSVGLNSEAAVEQQVHALDSIGVDFLKAYEMLTPEQFGTVTRVAREKGLKVTGHVPLSMDVIGASNAGLNSMEHLRNLELSCASNAGGLLQQRRQLLFAGKGDPGGILRSRIHNAQRETAIEHYDEVRADSVLQVLAKNQTWQIPTLALNTSSVERHWADPEWQSTFNYLPDSVEQQWNARIGDLLEQEITPFRKKYAEWNFNMVGKIHRAGIDIMAGTDCPISFLTPGPSLHRELELLVRSGLSPLEALKTATLNPARYFGMQEELGSVKEDQWADLIILNANPLENIENTREIEAVIKQGVVYNRAELEGILARLAER